MCIKASTKINRYVIGNKYVPFMQGWSANECMKKRN